ncbi:glycoside-pentoside-hexuronide (GPH):cation symporter [Bifidobacterium aquikefiri]|uniref:glycoside-pentoside-hexuronide (GPH):cation symporter n=1 Tax=Bifidobacterium aquikefiri TaxID=1653207 RepID=UPI0023F48849|nr:glycoside-pentoside-hexuronide (GPH):cation symporter [Bifidobacterium aquikefiri]
MNKVKQSVTYAFGAFGHDAFYAALTTYFITFITSQLLEGSDGKQINGWMVGFITTMIVIIRVIEIFFDPLIGAMIDNTKTKWGKFKPWIFGGAIVSSITLIMIFSNFFGLTESNPNLYLVLFAIVFIIADFSYSALDVAFWGLLPSLSLNSSDRTKIGTVARFGSTLGSTGTAIVLVPINIWISRWLTGSTDDTQTRAGWLGFAIFISALSLIGALLTCWGTQEGKSAIRKNVKKTSFKDIFQILGRNDQLMWLASSYFLFALGFAITNSMIVYYFRYVMDKPDEYSMVGVVEAVLGIVAVLMFPTLQNLITRKWVYVSSIGVMVIGYILYNFSGNNVGLTLVSTGLLYVAQPLVFLATLMTISDCVEYGQLRNGTRNESVTLTIRPLLDKLGGAFSNGIVGIAALGAGMTGAATAADITASGILHFKVFMLYIPMVFVIVAAIIFAVKITLTERRHAEIAHELETKFA